MSNAFFNRIKKKIQRTKIKCIQQNDGNIIANGVATKQKNHNLHFRTTKISFVNVSGAWEISEISCTEINGCKLFGCIRH